MKKIDNSDNNFKCMGYIQFHSSPLMIFDNETLLLDIHQKKLNKNYSDISWIKNSEAYIGSIIGHSLIYYNEVGEEGANEIRILSSKCIEDEIIKGEEWNTRRLNSIEKLFREKKDFFKVEKIKTKILNISNGEIGFILSSELFLANGENRSIRPYYTKKKKIDKNKTINVYGYYHDFMDNTQKVIGGFIKCKNGEYDIYSCEVNDKEYGYIIKLNNKKLTNENMKFMF